LTDRCLRVLLLSLLATSACGRAPTGPPNIVFVFADDHAFQAIGAYGGRLAGLDPTPNIDRLADEGMRFDSAYVTNSICAPSRAVILTGLHSHLNGVPTNAERFDGSQVTFPKLLQDAGYQTAIVGKWHLKTDPTGFDYWHVLPGQGQYYNPDFRTPGGDVRIEGYVTDVITDTALDWLDNRDPERPFMLMYQHKAPHREWQPGPDHLTTYTGVDIPEPETLFDDYAGRTSATGTQAMEIDRHMRFGYDLKLWPSPAANENPRPIERFRERLTPAQLDAWDAVYGPIAQEFYAADLEGDDLVRWKYQRYMQDYLASIKSVDDNFGRLLDYLDANDLAENTVVIYSSDQGFYLGEHGWFDKRWMYEESLRMPLIVRWPNRVASGSESTAIVSNLDFAETFLDIAGAEAPADMQGESLKPILEGVIPPDWRTSFYYHYYEYPGWHDVARHYGVRTERHKLIHFYTLDEWELYDLNEDPNELTSVYDDPDYADTVNVLKAELTRLREHYDVPEDTRPLEPMAYGR
jgi:arylsulfatase A-like enzyme